MPIRHTVRRGECFTSIAVRYGFKDYHALYDHPDNAALVENRPNPNVLCPGDIVVVPDLEQRELTLAVDQAHTVKVHRPKKELRVVFKDNEGKPLKGEAYVFSVPGRDPVENSTDGSGMLKEPVPLGAGVATVTIKGRTLHLSLGALTPIRETPDDGVQGAQARLANLGYNAGALDGALGRRTRAAIAVFQHDHDENIDGALSDALRDRLLNEHGA
jgi:hypothetical protein